MIKNKLGLIEKIVTEIRNFTDIAVVGMSGGVDSTVITTLCKLALGPENVYGIHMPYNEIDNKEGKFNSNSRKIAEKLGVKSIDAPVFDIVAAINSIVTSAVGYGEDLGKLGQVNGGNTRSRARMTVLYGICHELGAHTNKRCRVMGTGNLSEDFIGYDTKGGDALADLFPIGDLYKSEVYELAEFFAGMNEIEDSMIDRVPSAGLWNGQTDEEELGYTYNEMESGIRYLLEHGGDNYQAADCPIVNFVAERHFANKHKHEAPPIVALRDTDFLN